MTKNKATKYRTEFIVDVVSTYANVFFERVITRRLPISC
jgi:hypothetical protein